MKKDDSKTAIWKVLQAGFIRLIAVSRDKESPCATINTKNKTYVSLEIFNEDLEWVKEVCKQHCDWYRIDDAYHCNSDYEEVLYTCCIIINFHPLKIIKDFYSDGYEGQYQIDDDGQLVFAEFARFPNPSHAKSDYCLTLNTEKIMTHTSESKTALAIWLCRITTQYFAGERVEAPSEVLEENANFLDKYFPFLKERNGKQWEGMEQNRLNLFNFYLGLIDDKTVSLNNLPKTMLLENSNIRREV